MGNIKNYNFNKLDVRISNSDYWDFFLAADEQTITSYAGASIGDCLVVWYDFNDVNIYPLSATSATTISSLVSWDDATNTGYTFDTAGLTCIDNGLFTFSASSADTANTALLSALTASTLVITSGDSRLMMNQVTGTTGEYVYPITRVTDTSLLGDYITLCGGFYQGYYKIDGYDYQVLPVRAHKAWALDFWLNKSDMICSGTTGTTLNDTYPENKGFFFYMGTRAENKFWNIFEGLNTGCTSGCTVDSGCTGTVTTFCTIPKETDIVLDSGYPLSPPALTFTETDNGFLMYHRARFSKCGSCGSSLDPDHYGNIWPTGKIAPCFTGNSITYTSITQTVTDTRNPFVVYSRSRGKICGTCADAGVTGETVCSFSGFTSPKLELDYKVDIIDNALGFRIKDDGSIGYRLLTITGHCSGDTYVSGVTVEEQYSASGMVSDNKWTNIVIRFVANETYDDCELLSKKARKGKLMFYVNSKLKFVVNEFDEFIARRLNEYKDKQIGVPFNFSLGGGSQGLLESQTFDGQDPRDMNLPIQENFAGTFIGSISQFKFYICDINWCDIQNNYLLELPRYTAGPIADTNLILNEDGTSLLSEDGYGITWI